MLYLRLVSFFYPGNLRVDQLFQKKKNDTDVDPTIAAETKMVMLLIQHNTFFNISDHLCPLIRMNLKEAKLLNRLAAAEQKLQPLLTAWERISSAN